TAQCVIRATRFRGGRVAGIQRLSNARHWVPACAGTTKVCHPSPDLRRGDDSTTMAKVQLRDVRKSYADLEVIHGVDIEIADGEFIVIVGPSGCGKSTLLRMVAGLETITGGEIVIG